MLVILYVKIDKATNGVIVWRKYNSIVNFVNLSVNGTYVKSKFDTIIFVNFIRNSRFKDERIQKNNYYTGNQECDVKII